MYITTLNDTLNNYYYLAHYHSLFLSLMILPNAIEYLFAVKKKVTARIVLSWFCFVAHTKS